MLGARDVLCLCPAGRFYLVPVVLTTWTGVRRYVLTEDLAHEVSGFDAVIVMDEFVERTLVARLVGELPVIVLAWNGQFEIERYQRALGDLEVTYMGTDATGPSGLRYLPMIDGSCSFATWQQLCRSKRQFELHGDLRYRLRWLRTKLFAIRPLCVFLSAGAALVKRPRTALDTLKSGVIRDRVVWAGNCQYDPARVALSDVNRKATDEASRALSLARSPAEILRAGLELVSNWRAIDGSAQHEVLYVANTVMRWAVLGFLKTANRSATWFFGADNVGLALPYELDVYNLVPSRRIAFVDFGGKTSETLLYPRMLQLLGRDCYVIGFAVNAELGPLADQLRTRLEADAKHLFTTLEQRRRALYTSVTETTTLAELQARVWADFAAATSS